MIVRAGPRVQRLRFAGLRAALAELEREARTLATQASHQPVDAKIRRFEPQQVVAARLELAGPQRLLPDVHAGIDVRADGSTEAWQGQVRRKVVEQRRGEDPYAALRRALGDSV